MIRKFVSLGLIAVIAMSLVSCTAQSPTARPYPKSEQRKMQAAHHWDVLAEEVVEHMLVSNVSATKAIYVAPNPAPLPFEEAFRNFLVTQLVNGGFKVVGDRAASEMVMNYDIQVVQVPATQWYRQGVKAYVDIRRDGVLHYKTERVLHVEERGGCPFARLASLTYKRSNYEAITSVSLMDNTTKQCVFGHTDVYYIKTGDENYKVWPLPGAIMEVVDQ